MDSLTSWHGIISAPEMVVCRWDRREWIHMIPDENHYFIIYIVDVAGLFSSNPFFDCGNGSWLID